MPPGGIRFFEKAMLGGMFCGGMLRNKCARVPRRNKQQKCKKLIPESQCLFESLPTDITEKTEKTEKKEKKEKNISQDDED